MKQRFDHHQYVPVLRWKSSEREALCNLNLTQKQCITPIFEPVPKDFAKVSTNFALSRQAKQIAETWGWSELFFMDFHLLDENTAVLSVPLFTKQADAYNLKAGLVTGLNRPENFQAAVKTAVKKNSRELCFRISAYDLRQGGFQQSLKNLLNFYGKKPADVHLAVDFQTIGNPLPQLAAFTNTIPNLNDWRSLTVISGAFPKDLSHLEKNSQYELARNDWLMWRYYATTAKTRIPSFGDYTIQHGIFEEHEGQFFNFSASLRYTSDEYWVVMRGEGVQNVDGAGFKQFPAQAQLLTERSEFRGAQFSFGDHYIHSMGQQYAKSGHAKDWLAATFNHHIIFVLWQLENTFANAGNGALSTESSPSLHVGQA